MNNGLLRCVVLIIYLIFQVQVIAAETNYIYKNDIASKFNFKEVFFLNNFFSSKVSESIFLLSKRSFLYVQKLIIMDVLQVIQII